MTTTEDVTAAPRRRAPGATRVAARSRATIAAPYLLSIAFAAAYATLSLARLHRLETRSWDVAIFEQAISHSLTLGSVAPRLLPPTGCRAARACAVRRRLR